MAAAVYILCAVTAAICAYLLLRASRASNSRFLLWCGLCFVGLTFNNITLFLDKEVIHHIDLLPYRSFLTLSAMSILVYGLVMETAR